MFDDEDTIAPAVLFGPGSKLLASGAAQSKHPFGVNSGLRPGDLAVLRGSERPRKAAPPAARGQSDRPLRAQHVTK